MESLEANHFRAVSPTETVYLRADTRVVSHSAAVGAITRQQFQTALNALEAHYPILRAVVNSGNFVERETFAVFSWLDRATHELEPLYQAALTHPLDPAISIYALQVLADDFGFDILLISSHAIADATALVAIHSSLIHFCDCAIRDITLLAEPQGFPESIDPAVKLCYLASDISKHKTTAPNFAPDDFIFLPVQPAASPSYGLEQLVIAADRMPEIFATCRSHDVSLHSLLAAAFCLAIRKLAGGTGHELLLRHTVDMRRRLQPHISPNLIFTAVTGHVSHIENMNGTVFEIARAIQTDIRGATADGRILQEYQNYAESFGKPQTVPIALNLSDMGVVAFHDEISVLQPTGFDYATALIQPFPNCSITIYGDRLVAMTAYRTDLIAPATIRALSNHVSEILHQSCNDLNRRADEQSEIRHRNDPPTVCAVESSAFADQSKLKRSESANA